MMGLISAAPATAQVKLGFKGGITTCELKDKNSILDSNMNPTGILVTLTSDFGGTNKNGATYTTTKRLMPADVSSSALWGYAVYTYHFRGVTLG